MVLAAVAAGAYASLLLDFDTAPIRDVQREKTRDIPAIPFDARQIALSEADIVESAARPLFNASRRPFVPQPVKVEAQKSDVKATAPVETVRRRIRLLGVNLIGITFTALVQNQDNQEVRWIRKGQAFDGWVLVEADRESAHFTCAEKTGSDCHYDVELYAARQSK
jgi:hypothetical protein